MKLEQLRALWAASLAKCEEIKTKAGAENRGFTEEERTTLTSELANMDRLDADIKIAKDLETRASATRPDQQTQRPGAAATTHNNAEDKPFQNIGEFLRSVHNAAEQRDLGSIDPRLLKCDLRISEVRAAAGMSETVASDGGFTVPTQWGDQLQKAAFDTGLLAKETNQLPLDPNTNTLKVPAIDETSRADGSRWGGVQVYWADEAASATATKPKFGLIELNLKKLLGLVYLTDELAADNSAVSKWVMQAFSEEFGFKMDDGIIRGSGAGAMLGILNSQAKVAVAKETSQAAASILYANVSKMRNRLLPRSFARANWYVNVDTLPQLEQMFIPAKNVAGTENVGGYPAYLPPGGASDAPYGKIFGRPVIPIEQCETCGTEGDIILADLAMYLMITKGAMQTASSIHVKFVTDEVAFRFAMRLDGQPAVKKPVTPYKGSGTLSPFVTLAVRS